MNTLRQRGGFLILSAAVLMSLNISCADTPCDVVAVVFDTTICQKDIAADKVDFFGKPFSIEHQHKSSNNRLMKKIRDISAQHLLAKGSYTVTTKEVDAHLAFMKISKANRTKHYEEIIATIAHLLKTYHYTDRHRKRLEKSLAIFQKSADIFNRMAKETKLEEEEFRKQFGEAALKEKLKKKQELHRSVSEQWVSSWKMNKALYEKYCGKVIFQQAGIEPIDAYRAQLKDIREKGHLKILKSNYINVFAEMEKYLALKHSYMGEDHPKFFDRPYWETVDMEKEHQLTIEKYKKTPHIKLKALPD